MEFRNCLIGIVASAAFFSGTAYAAGVTPDLGLNVIVSHGSTTDANWSLTNNSPYTTNPDGTYNYSGTNPANSIWNFGWNVNVNPDPLINGPLTIVNLTGNTETFNILFSLPVGSGFSPGQMSGSLGGSFTDYNGDGVVSLGNINWSGIVDANSNAMSLVAFGGTCGPGSPGCSINLSPVSGGPTLYTPGVTSSIGLKLSFDLSAGDKANFTTSVRGYARANPGSYLAVRIRPVGFGWRNQSQKGMTV